MSEALPRPGNEYRTYEDYEKAWADWSAVNPPREIQRPTLGSLGFVEDVLRQRWYHPDGRVVDERDRVAQAHDFWGDALLAVRAVFDKVPS